MNNYIAVYNLDNGSRFHRPVSRTQALNLLVYRRFNHAHCEVAVYTQNGEMIGESLHGNDSTLPAEYRYGWYNTDLMP